MATQANRKVAWTSVECSCGQNSTQYHAEPEYYMHQWVADHRKMGHEIERVDLYNRWDNKIGSRGYFR